MPFLVGTDEAGYGPNLGPLVVTGTLWKVPRLPVSLYDVLQNSISDKNDKQRIQVCDSKKLYQSSGAIGRLESNVLGILGFQGNDYRDLTKRLGCGRQPNEEDIWLAGAELQLPIKANTDAIASIFERFKSDCLENQIELVAVESKTVFPPEFNAGIERHQNKATLLTATTLEIVRNLTTRLDDDVKIVCDKHGGRAKYAGVLQHFLTDSMIEVVSESLEASSYRWQTDNSKTEIEFLARGDASNMPVAFASMVSKYLRELFMKLWNQFWQIKLPNLKPTKGYPQDAKRFWAEIEQECKRLQIPRKEVWRSR